MDFTKYVDLLHTKTLFFCNSMRFEDPLDSSFWNVTSKPLRKLIKEKDPSIPKGIENLFNVNKAITYANCWHMNKVESAALWKLYLKSNEGIAIKSISGRLKKALAGCPHEVYIAKVAYSNNHVGTPTHKTGKSYSTLDAARLKHPSFSHEKELRSIIIENQGSNGIKIKIDLDILIQKVYIAPKTSMWLKKLIEGVSKKYGHNFEVKESELYQNPFD